MSIFDFTGISTAIAETVHQGGGDPAATGQGSLLHMLPMLIIFVVVFYFLLVRPQTKRAKEQKKLMSNLAVGDEIVTAGGMVGRLVKVKDNFVVITIANGIDVTMQKNSIASVLPKGTLESMN